MYKNRLNFILQRYQVISSTTGMILIVSGILLLIPLLTLFFYPVEISQSASFVYTSLLMISLGFMMYALSGKSKGRELGFNDSAIIVVLSWVLIPLISSLPYIYVSGMSFTRAFFESVSGWTTTGLSSLDVTMAPKVMLIFRAWTQFLGGAGMAIIMIASITGLNAAHLYAAEGKANLIIPNVIASAKIVMALYLLYLVLGVVAYILAGMNCLDSIAHTFASISTGGFSTRPESIGYYNSFPIELITMILMILGNLNFVTAYLLFKRQFLLVLRNGELKVFSVMIPLSVFLLFIATGGVIYHQMSQSLRVAFFESVSALTTTGYSLVNYNNPPWNDLAMLVLIVLMLIGGGTCSTAGGIKQYRLYIIYKSVIWQIRRTLLPQKAVVRNFIWEGEQKKYLTAPEIVNTANFIGIYFAVYLLGVITILASRNPATNTFYSLRDALFENASALSTVGLSVGVTSPTTPAHITWILSLGMLLGRLEFIVVILAIMQMVNDSRSTCLNLFHKDR